MNEYLRNLASEYLQLCSLMASGDFDGMQLSSLSAQRTWTHNELIRLLGSEYDRPFDMRAHCRQLLSETD